MVTDREEYVVEQAVKDAEPGDHVITNSDVWLKVGTDHWRVINKDTGGYMGNYSDFVCRGNIVFDVENLESAWAVM